MGGPDAAWRKWSTSIVGGDFTVPHGERQTTALRCALLDVFNACRITLQNRHLVRGRVFHPIAGAFSVWLREHNVALRGRLLHLVSFFVEIDVRDTAGESICPLFDIDIAFVMNRTIRI